MEIQVIHGVCNTAVNCDCLIYKKIVLHVNLSFLKLSEEIKVNIVLNQVNYVQRRDRGMEVREEGSYTYHYNVITRITPALRWAVMRDIVMFY